MYKNNSQNIVGYLRAATESLISRGFNDARYSAIRAKRSPNFLAASGRARMASGNTEKISRRIGRSELR